MDIVQKPSNSKALNPLFLSNVLIPCYFTYIGSNYYASALFSDTFNCQNPLRVR